MSGLPITSRRQQQNKQRREVQLRSREQGMEVPQSGPPRQQPAAKKQHRSTSKTTAHQTVAQLVMALPLFSAKNSSVQCLGVHALFKHIRRGSGENGKRLGWQFSYILVTSSLMNIGNFQGDGDHRKAREEHPPTYQRRLCLHPLNV